MRNIFKISNNEGVNKYRSWVIYGLIAGLIVFIFSSLYFYNVFNLPSTVRPSSTDGLKYPFAFSFCLLFAFFGMIFGAIIGKIIELILSVFIKTHIKIIIASLILGLPLLLVANNSYSKLFKQAKIDQEISNARNVNGIKYDIGAIEKTQVNVKDLKNYNLDLNKEHAVGYIEGEDLPAKREFEWNGKKYTFIYDEYLHILVRNADGSIFIVHNIATDNYVVSSSFIIYKDALFVLSRLRETSRQSLLTVFS